MTSLSIRHTLFAGICALSLAEFHGPVERLVSLALQDDRYTAMLAIPLISAAIIWLNRRSIFADTPYRFATRARARAIPPIALFAISAMLASFSPKDVLPISFFALLLTVMGAFIGCYGTHAAKAALFPLAFLVLMIPIPASILDRVVVALQHGSAEVSYRILKLTGVPVFRESAVKFSLPGVTIEVADECSGIRSSLSLFIASLVGGYLLLRSSWSRAVLALMTIPIVIFKNAVRIVTISCLGVYVDPGFLYGRLHRYGGLPFSLIALAMLAPVLLLLMRAERHRQPPLIDPGDPASAAVV